jgi:hypothetical protein
MTTRMGDDAPLPSPAIQNASVTPLLELPLDFATVISSYRLEYERDLEPIHIAASWPLQASHVAVRERAFLAVTTNISGSFNAQVETRTDFPRIEQILESHINAVNRHMRGFTRLIINTVTIPEGEVWLVTRDGIIGKGSI